MQYLVCIFGLLIIACDQPAPTSLVRTALDQGRGPELDHALMDMAEDNGIEDAGLPRDQTLNDLSVQDAGAGSVSRSGTLGSAAKGDQRN